MSSYLFRILHGHKAWHLEKANELSRPTEHKKRTTNKGKKNGKDLSWSYLFSWSIEIERILHESLVESLSISWLFCSQGHMKNNFATAVCVKLELEVAEVPQSQTGQYPCSSVREQYWRRTAQLFTTGSLDTLEAILDVHPLWGFGFRTAASLKKKQSDNRYNPRTWWKIHCSKDFQVSLERHEVFFGKQL